MALNKLNYEFEDSPSWREVEVKTSEMISQITQWRVKYNELLEDAKEFCDQQFARAMAIDYIHNLNVGEMVGTQSQEDTEELLKKWFDEPSEKSQLDSKRTERETINTYKAMKLLRQKAKEMGMTGMLTVQEICDVHSLLLKDVHKDCGKIRTKEAYTHWHNGHHFYPEPKLAECLLYSLIDHHNMNMEKKPSSGDPNEYTEYIFKCAARLLFDFVDTHPFGDGNGRMCRLLANYVVSLITPFPVSVYHTRDRAQSGRKDYLDAIVHCREYPDEGPRGLAAMLVEGAWRGWDSLFKNLERRGQLTPEKFIGPIVVKQSACNEQYVTKRVDNVWSYAENKGVQETKEKVIELILGVIEETDVSTLSRTQYIQKSVPVSNGHVRLDIYGD